MLWGLAAVALLVFALRGFDRTRITRLRDFKPWMLGLGLATLVLLLALIGRPAIAAAALLVLGPVLLLRGRAREPRPKPASASRARMSAEEALAVLGLKPGATKDEIRAAYLRMMKAAHPDHGGSDWLASRINEAREILLRR
jgi:hypothetical protein